MYVCVQYLPSHFFVKGMFSSCIKGSWNARISGKKYSLSFLFSSYWMLIEIKNKECFIHGNKFIHPVKSHFNYSNTTGATSGAATVYPSCGRISSGVSVTRSLIFCVVFCRSLFVLWSFLFWPLCCLSFDLRIIITPLITSSSTQLE